MTEAEARVLVNERSHNRCELCGSTETLTFSHRTPKSLGGKWAATNGIRACGSGTTGCHGWIEHHPEWAEAGGWRVKPYEDPATVPVYLTMPWPGWWILTDDGHYESTWLTAEPDHLPPQGAFRP